MIEKLKSTNRSKGLSDEIWSDLISSLCDAAQSSEPAVCCTSYHGCTTRAESGLGNYNGQLDPSSYHSDALQKHAPSGKSVSPSDLSDSCDADVLKHLGRERQREVNHVRQQRYRARKRHRIQTIDATNIYVNAAGMHPVMEEKVAGDCATVGRGFDVVGYPTRTYDDVINQNTTGDTNRGDIDEGSSGGSDVENVDDGWHRAINVGVVDTGSRGQDQQRRNRRRKHGGKAVRRSSEVEPSNNCVRDVVEESFENELSDNERIDCMRRLQSALGADGLNECVFTVSERVGLRKNSRRMSNMTWNHTEIGPREHVDATNPDHDATNAKFTRPAAAATTYASPVAFTQASAHIGCFVFSAKCAGDLDRFPTRYARCFNSETPFRGIRQGPDISTQEDRVGEPVICVTARITWY
ncbi:hypothetical protein ON010_g14091 [Phytophthora cinnamomi]|nr:hypothetical protein ON010_g14091 [Phytophthora cinnamomi]